MGKGKRKKIPQKQNMDALAKEKPVEAEDDDGFPALGSTLKPAPPVKTKTDPALSASPGPSKAVEDDVVGSIAQGIETLELSSPTSTASSSDLPVQPSPSTPIKQPQQPEDQQQEVQQQTQPQHEEHPPHPSPPAQPHQKQKQQQAAPVKHTETVSGVQSIGFTKRQFEPPRAANRSEKVGTQGKPLKVEVNFLPMTIKVPGGTVYHYDCDFKFPWKREVRKSDRPFLIQVVEAFKKAHQSVLGNPYSIVFDGLKNIYACRRLKFPGAEFQGKAPVPKDQDSEEMIEMTVTIKLVNTVEINHAVEEYTRRGTSATRPADAMQVLNIILGMTPQLRYVSVGRNYFSHDHKDCVVDLGGAKSLWVGTFKSVRMGWLPMLNVDMANKPAYERMPVVDFIQKLTMRGSGGGRQGYGQQQQQNRGPPVLTDHREIQAVENELRGLKVRYNRPDGQKRDYRVNKLMAPAQELKMKLDTGEVITIQKYFEKTYKTKLRLPALPCLHIGDPTKTIYIPMEFCEIKQQLAPLSKKLTDIEGANMIKKTAVPPTERTQRLKDNMKAMNHYYQKDPYAKEFGILVEDKWLQIDARVLAPPVLKYQLGSKPDVPFNKVYGGKWNMGANRDQEKYKFVKGASLNNWGLLDMARLSDRQINDFINALYTEGSSRGLEIDYPEYGKADIRNYLDIEQQFFNLRKAILDKKKVEPQLIMLICSEKGTFRNNIKYLGDAVLNIPTQFVMKANVLGKNGGPSVQTIHNICLKLNSKIGGINQALAARPPIMKVPVMIMGADVTHPSPSDMSKKPSIAAVVGSCDPNASKYNSEVRLQNSGQVVEVIEKMEEMTKSLILKFQQNSGHWPRKIIFYRDGVSEGQFIDVLNHELMAIRRACKSLEQKRGGNYEPQMTFIVAQKRHKTFPKPVNERDGAGDTKNVPPGTIIDTVICHPTEKDFYLASQLAIKGTVKPAHYHVLWDENRLSPDEIQRLTYDLCHLYSRCERSVSYPAPTYYSHLAAFRAREHHNCLIDKTPNKKSEEVKPEDIAKMETLDIFNYFI